MNCRTKLCTFNKLSAANGSGKVTTTSGRIKLLSSTTTTRFIHQIGCVRHGHRIAGFRSIDTIAGLYCPLGNTHAPTPTGIGSGPTLYLAKPAGASVSLRDRAGASGRARGELMLCLQDCGVLLEKWLVRHQRSRYAKAAALRNPRALNE